jgi:hypothetical protein
MANPSEERAQLVCQTMVLTPLSFAHRNGDLQTALPLTARCLRSCRISIPCWGLRPVCRKATGSRSSRNRTFVHLRGKPLKSAETRRNNGPARNDDTLTLDRPTARASSREDDDALASALPA